ncbi:MAG: hypothetical protein ACRESO_08865 [Gammaproteobacteria bacterium]
MVEVAMCAGESACLAPKQPVTTKADSNRMSFKYLITPLTPDEVRMNRPDFFAKSFLPFAPEKTGTDSAMAAYHIIGRPRIASLFDSQAVFNDEW